MERQRILRFLPENYQLAALDPGGVLWAALGVMEGLHAPVDRILRSIDSYFDPYRAPDPFVLLQASWLGLDRYFDWSGGTPGVGEARYPAGTDQLRLLIAEFPELVRSRGTHRSLTRFLEVATGVRGFVVEDGDKAGEAFHILVGVPTTATPLLDLVDRVIAGERPAHATWEIRMIADPPGNSNKKE
jgi:phage tail-like protein